MLVLHAIGVVLALVGTAVAAALQPRIGGAIFAPLFSAVVTTAWLGGFRAALTSAAAGAILIEYYLLPAAPGALRDHLWDVGAFATFALSASWMISASRRRLHEREQVARERQARQTALEEAQARIAETNAVLTAFLDGSPVAFIFYDRALRVSRVNAAMAAIAGRSVSDLHGRSAEEIVTAEASAIVLPKLRRVLETGEPSLGDEFVTRSPADGREHHWLGSMYPVFVEGDLAGVGCALIETTEQVLLQQQFLQAQKMEAIGRLAGGVAHDFNNVLTAIIGTAELALMTDRLPAELTQDLETIRDAGRGGARLTRQLLAFSRKQVTQPRTFDPNDVIRQMQPLLRQLADGGVTLQTQLEADAVLQMDPVQLEQIVLNLVVNANDAMPAGGTITITTRTHQAGANDHAEAQPETYCCLEVRDDGVGMDADTQARIFEPFFTTKKEGQGTGLGLATVYGIVKQAGGHIHVESAPGAGSTFRVCLPTVHPPVVTTGEYRVPGGAERGSEVVLVVEDEIAVRTAVCRELRSLGYYVIEAKHGEDALTLMQEHHAPVHLLITDLIMPEMGGAELVSTLRSWYPELRVVIISGYSRDVAKARGAAEDAMFLPKPFSMEQLARTVRAALDRDSLAAASASA